MQNYQPATLSQGRYDSLYPGQRLVESLRTQRTLADFQTSLAYDGKPKDPAHSIEHSSSIAPELPPTNETDRNIESRQSRKSVARGHALTR